MHARDLLIGAAAGSALMFMLDPSTGTRRRALARDRMTRATRKTRDGLEAAARDIGNRASGLAATTRGRWSDEAVDDATVVERVRAKLGRVCSHPRAIDVDARDGRVTLRGQVLFPEMRAVVATALAVRGVGSVDNQLEAYDTAEGVPGLQGEGRTAGRLLNLRPRTWAPGTRAMVGAGVIGTAMWMALKAARSARDLTLADMEYRHGVL
jgi:BON domain